VDGKRQLAVMVCHRYITSSAPDDHTSADT
jgi:hypothetical protein